MRTVSRTERICPRECYVAEHVLEKLEYADVHEPESLRCAASAPFWPVAEIALRHICADNEVEPTTRHNIDMASSSMPSYGLCYRVELWVIPCVERIKARMCCLVCTLAHCLEPRMSQHPCAAECIYQPVHFPVTVKVSCQMIMVRPKSCPFRSCMLLDSLTNVSECGSTRDDVSAPSEPVS